jgi:HAE1 family hydrophobic/amphiphilic exporter-1
MSLTASFVRNPVKVAVGVILLTLFGLIALKRMPIQLIPEVTIPTLTIETRWPGASPQEVEREIILEQEEQLQSVEGATKMTSESMDSFGRITLEFAVGTDMSEALLKVNARLQQVREYPENADLPVISTSNSSDRPIGWFMLNQRLPTAAEIEVVQAKHPDLRAELERIKNAHNPGLALFRLRNLAAKDPRAKGLLPPEVDLTTMRRFMEDVVEARFERVPGVSNCNVVGGREDEMQVIVDPEQLAARQLTINDVRQALRLHNRDTSAGDFWEGKRRYVVRTTGQFRSPEQVASVIISRREGKPVYVRDVADVQLGYKKPDGIIRRFGTTVIGCNVLRQTGTNVLEVMEAIRQANRELNENILYPQGLELTQVYDETEYITSAVGLVEENIWEGAFLTVLVLLVFLRSIRSTLIIFLSIAVSIVGMFLMMYLMGRTLNVPSLAGIAFAVGMLVDNFIVVLENIYRRRLSGESSLDAIVNGTREVGGAVLSSTLTNLAVFVPVLFVQDQAGQLFRDIALATSSALGLSLLVALIMVPTAASLLFRRMERASALHETDGAPTRPGLLRRLSLAERFHRVTHFLTGPLDWFGGKFINVVVGINAWVQRGVLRQVAVVLLLMGASIYFSYLLLPKVEYLPGGNRNLIIGIMLPPPGYNLDQLKEIGEELEASLEPYWNIDPDTPEAEVAPYPVIGDFFYVARGRSLFMGIRSHDPLRAPELVPLMREAGSKVPGMFMVAKQTSLFEQGLTAGRTVDVEITGPDITKLVALGGQVIGRVQQAVPGAQAIPKPSLDLSSPEVHVRPKWDQAADLGINATDLGYTVDALVDGAYATDYYLGGDKIDLTIIGKAKFASRTQDLKVLSIATPTGELVPLEAVADVRLSSGPEQINRRERQRAITIEVSPPPEIALEDTMDRIRAEIIQPLQDSGQLGGGYYINLSGTADKLRSTWNALRWNLVLAVVIAYLLMAALFESWLYPFVIILSVPLGAVGGFLGLRLLNLVTLQTLDVLTMLGFIILVGTVVNNPILIVEQALVHIREEGMHYRQAVLESVRTRIRPIFMTALIGFFGLLPLVISPGAGSELYRGLGSVLLGGLVVSTIFTLVFAPTLFTLTLQAREGLLRLLGFHTPPAATATPVAVSVNGELQPTPTPPQPAPSQQSAESVPAGT